MTTDIFPKRFTLILPLIYYKTVLSFICLPHHFISKMSQGSSLWMGNFFTLMISSLSLWKYPLLLHPCWCSPTSSHQTLIIMQCPILLAWPFQVWPEVHWKWFYLVTHFINIYQLALSTNMASLLGHRDVWYRVPCLRWVYILIVCVVWHLVIYSGKVIT